MEATEHGWKHIRGNGGARRHSKRASLESAKLAKLPFGDALDAEELAGAVV
jgi:hypothetical protein